MKCNPWRWLFGLIPLLLLTAFAVLKERSPIEAELTQRAKVALQGLGARWANVTFEGRDALISGKAIEEDDARQVATAVLAANGVRVVTSAATLIDKVERYEWSALKRDRRIRLNGLVPSARIRRDIIGKVRATFPGLEVEDKMDYARSDIAADTWLGGVEFGLKQLAVLKQGQVDLERTSLSVRGEAADIAGYRAVKTALEKGLPKGINLKHEAVRAPLVKPYLWGAKLEGPRLVLSGYAPTDTARAGIVGVAKRAFPKLQVVDGMEPGDGAPDGFQAVVSGIIAQLAGLETGEARLRDGAISITGMAETAAKADAVKAALRTRVPRPYRVSEDIRHREPVIKPVSPYVTGVRIDGSVVRLTGFVPTNEARQDLVAATRRAFAGRTVRDELELGAGQPPGWQRCLDGALGALQRVGNGRADLSDRRLLVSGTTPSEPLALALPGELRAATAGGCDAEARITLEPVAVRPPVDDGEARRKAEEEAARRQAAALAAQEEARRLAAEAEARRRAEAEARLKAEQAARAAAEAERRRAAAVACQTQMRTLARQGVILFQRARADIDPASYATLNQIAKAANRCPEVRIEVEGHTDTDGTPERNQALSDRRARAVADYLVRAGVQAERLSAVGYGQARNVAPNDTPQNKALNRRIEFSVRTQ